MSSFPKLAQLCTEKEHQRLQLPSETGGEENGINGQAPSFTGSSLKGWLLFHLSWNTEKTGIVWMHGPARNEEKCAVGLLSKAISRKNKLKGITLLGFTLYVSYSYSN